MQISYLSLLFVVNSLNSWLPKISTNLIQINMSFLRKPLFLPKFYSYGTINNLSFCCHITPKTIVLFMTQNRTKCQLTFVSSLKL